MPSSESSSSLPFDATPEGVDAWLAGLPIGNAREYCRQLYAGLQALNCATLDPLPRYRLLERLGATVEVESGKLMAAFVDKPLPLDEKVRKSAKLSAQFQLELARGYQAVVSTEAAGFTGDDVARLIHRALLAYEQYLLRLALMYEPVSSRLWLNVHSLLQLAARAHQEGFAAVEVFKRIVCFRLVGPSRLEQDQVLRLHDLLCEHSGLIGLASEPASDRAEAEFFIDLTSAALPGPVPPECSAGENRRFLYTDAFCRRISLQMQPSTPEKKRLAENFAVDILVRLGGAPPYTTEQKGRQVTVAAGLAGILVVAAKAERIRSAGESWSADLELVPLTDYGRGSSALSKSAGTFGAETRRSAGNDAARLRTHSEGEFPCKVLRADTPGFYLLETAAPLRVGGLAAMNTDNKLIQVGVISAPRQRGGGRLHVFQLLANDVRPVRVLGSAIGAPTNALVGTGVSERRVLTLPPSKLRNGSVLELDTGGRRESYCISRQLDTTAEFSLVEVIPASPAA